MSGRPAVVTGPEITPKGIQSFLGVTPSDFSHARLCTASHRLKHEDVFTSQVTSLTVEKLTLLACTYVHSRTLTD